MKIANPRLLIRQIIILESPRLPSILLSLSKHHVLPDDGIDYLGDAPPSIKIEYFLVSFLYGHPALCHDAMRFNLPLNGERHTPEIECALAGVLRIWLGAKKD